MWSSEGALRSFIMLIDEYGRCSASPTRRQPLGRCILIKILRSSENCFDVEGEQDIEEKESTWTPAQELALFDSFGDNVPYPTSYCKFNTAKPRLTIIQAKTSSLSSMRSTTHRNQSTGNGSPGSTGRARKVSRR